MAVYVVTWNLNKEKSNYSAARDAFIKHLEGAYPCKSDDMLESVRFIKSALSAEKISTHLRQKMDGNDGLLISRMDEYYGWLSVSTWEWIASNK